MRQREDEWRPIALVVRWTARVWSVASIGLVVLFMIGEGFNPAQLTPNEWLGFVFFPFGVCLGMALAWWKEWLGGGIAVASLAVFYSVHLVTAGRLPSGLAWLAFTAPAFLFLLAWFWSKKTGNAVDACRGGEPIPHS